MVTAFQDRFQLRFCGLALRPEGKLCRNLNRRSLATVSSTAPKPARSQGFTLIELLVVIAIIVILAAILFPVFGRARENARRSSCQSNMKNVMLSFVQYTQDYDEWYPVNRIVYSGTPPAGAPQGWADSLQPYIKSYQILQCPSNSIAGQTTNPGAPQYSDYTYNIAMSRANGGSFAGNPALIANVRGVSEAQCDFPSLTVVLAEYGQALSPANNNAYVTFSGGPNQGFANPGNGVDLRRHLDGSNFAFVDGHVKWFKGPPTGSNVSPKVYRQHHPFASGLAAFNNVAGSGSSPTLHVSDSITTQQNF